MNFSASIYSTDGDEFRIRLETICDHRLPDEVADIVCHAGLEIAEVELAHISGRKASIKTLMAIAHLLANVFKENKNLIYYFYCDDMSDVVRRHKEITPQEFRSTLFSKMFERYTVEHDMGTVFNIPIHIKGENYKVFQHILIREEHMVYAKAIRDAVYKDYGK